jgi:hypothetical protein
VLLESPAASSSIAIVSGTRIFAPLQPRLRFTEFHERRRGRAVCGRGPSHPCGATRALLGAEATEPYHGKALGHMPIIDRNFRAQHESKAEWAREVERMKLIHMPDPDDVIFYFRTMAERINARLKDEFGARFVRVRGAIKVKCHLVFGLVALTVDQILGVTKLRPALT